MKGEGKGEIAIQLGLHRPHPDLPRALNPKTKPEDPIRQACSAGADVYETLTYEKPTEVTSYSQKTLLYIDGITTVAEMQWAVGGNRGDGCQAKIANEVAAASTT